VPGPPAAALTVAGGESKAVGGAGKYEDVFAWSSTLAHCLGEEVGKDAYRTRAFAEIKGLVITNKPVVFEANEISASLVAEHRFDRDSKFSAPSLSFGGANGIVLEGSPVTVEFDDQLIDKYPTYSKYEDAFRTKKKFFEAQSQCMPGLPKRYRFGGKLPRIQGGYIQTSIVKALVWKGTTYPGNMLAVPDFGRIYFGEILLHEYNRRLTMLRFDLGCDNDGRAGGGEVDPNGVWGG
jgi:hypothetical protein